MIRWQAAPRRAGGARPGLWAAVAGAAVLLTLAVIAARTAGWLHWGNLLMLVPAGVLVMAFGAAWSPCSGAPWPGWRDRAFGAQNVRRPKKLHSSRLSSG